MRCTAAGSAARGSLGRLIEGRVQAALLMGGVRWGRDASFLLARYLATAGGMTLEELGEEAG